MSIEIKVNTRLGVRTAADVSVQIAVAHGCSLPVGCAAGGACAQQIVQWSTGRVSAASKAFSTTAPATTRTRARTSHSRARSPTAASAGSQCHSSPCSCPVSCATSRLKDAWQCVSAAMTEPNDPAVGARTQIQSTMRMSGNQRRRRVCVEMEMDGMALRSLNSIGV